MCRDWDGESVKQGALFSDDDVDVDTDVDIDADPAEARALLAEMDDFCAEMDEALKEKPHERHHCECNGNCMYRILVFVSVVRNVGIPSRPL